MTRLKEMHAVTIDRFGGPDVLTYGRQRLPDVGPGQVLVKVAYAGVGSWDPLEREGLFAELTGQTPDFPYTLGRDGSGTIAAIGVGVDRFAIGDAVYALGIGHYAEYIALDADAVSLLPDDLPLDQAGAMPIVALTAWQGLAIELDVAPGDAVLINGASGDVGHIAVQLAKRLGARVLAVASGEDGVAAALELGADVAVDGRVTDVAAASRAFAPKGLDAVLAVVGGASLSAAIGTVRERGRVAYPAGIDPEPEPRAGLVFRHFDLTLDAPATSRVKMEQLNALIAAGPFEVRISSTFPLGQAAQAHQALAAHRIGKVILSVPS
ncbi:NADP-dependent oxidoreductase [Luteimonas fraxinea]|uniref:NADP-dependent oxidoreductase n=1 Tax=Luteimonas fraxinea TaxID=2901869 RepID=A0ABS8UF27_9GAMM|nr:NADP-dependent oxidoreductase [Luteimonas fraxinea]MCD9097457.1 NADP-dependent oxidoreductase [Luteimonas fraxinea]MCD9124985.1 NADP-dependent oxidoreductase [Luteimonas fraxinea]UHH11712.1 NADP-dependent oxidoreductase [Luteimonas fraxinea]